MSIVKWVVIILSVAVMATVAFRLLPPRPVFREANRPVSASGVKLIEHPKTPADKIVNAAKMQAINEVSYDASYQRIPFPGGDVPADRGACTDVIVRALRAAGCDLQKLIHDDKTANPSAYPRYGGSSKCDPNIDHRRVPNHLAFMRRHAKSLPTTTDGDALATWQPGDLVYWKWSNGLDHCGVVSNVKDSDGIPLVIHNMSVAREEDVVNSWQIVGHFRFP